VLGGDVVNLGFVGLGVMGLPMASRLIRAGHQVTVYDVRGEAVEEAAAAGGLPAGSPREVAAAADIVLTSLPTVSAVESVVLDETDGVIAGLRPGALLIELSTISMPLVREIHAALAANGAQVLDAPVTQSTGRVADGHLTIMVGGEADVLDRARPILEVLGTHIRHMGPAGAGAASKLATQYAGVCNLVTAAEAMLLARDHGVDPESYIQLAPGSIGESRMFDLAASWLTREGEGPPAGITGFLGIFEKDIRLGVEAAVEAGSRHDLGQACADLFAEGVARGGADDHYLSVLDLLQTPAEPVASIREPKEPT
jgi:3-hydroxyisobutyrate dehydrogenase-like beta-hydroxyacid dehydrogenase